ncbi:MAG: SGNH/GDSL hydrolase family protein [Acidobacteria bacterium]|nr:SGNH/GDSL hydrolase family protein [Acidobacteriota bacterium]
MLGRPSKIKSWAIKQLKVLGVLLVGLLLAELALRIVGYSVPNLYTTDPDRGGALRAGAEGWWRKEGEAYIKISSDGLRDREHTRQKPPGTLRIAVLGDSWPEALQVPLEKTFWAVMEKKLSECAGLAGRKVEAINFGVSGYGTAQELITLRRHVWEYSPDIVLLVFNGANDVSDNSRALRKQDDIPYFIYRDGALVLDSRFRESPNFQFRVSTWNKRLKVVRDYSRVLQFAYDLLNVTERNKAARQQRRDAAGSEPALDTAFYRPPNDQVWNDAWAVTDHLLTGMSDEVAKGGAKFLVVSLGSPIEVNPDPRMREEFIKRLGVSDLSYPDQRVRKLGERAGFEVLSLTRPLQSYAEQQKIFLHGFGRTLGTGHWNADGHRVVGEVIAQKLCEWFR